MPARSPVLPSLLRFSSAVRTEPPAKLGIRYDAQGRFLREPGNTVVCHLYPGSAEEQAIVGLRQRMMAMSDADHLAFTPVPSLHMTLFQGLLEFRRDWPYWPKELPSDLAIDATTAYYASRLRDFEGRGRFHVSATGLTPNGIVVEGATSEDRDSLAAWRDALSIPFGYRHPDHDSYEFHITLAYPIRWLAPERLPAWQEFLDDELALLQAELPVMRLRPPAFCRFEDMCRFEELVVLT